MDFDLSADQVALRDAATELLNSESSSQRVRTVVDSGGGWDRELWNSLCQQGWPGLLLPESLGGVGLGWVEGTVVLEAIGAHTAAVPVLSQLVGAAVLSETDSAVLPAVSDGDSIVAISSKTLTATRSDDQADEGWYLTGQTEPFAFAPSADLVLIVAESDGAESLYALDCSELEIDPLQSMDLTRELGRLDLDAVPAEKLGESDLVELFRDSAAVAYCAEMLGCATAALDMAVEYAGQREQFGRPIGSFQAIKHRCADMLVDVEAMRSSTWWAAWCLANSTTDASVAASTAKAWCSDAADRVVTSALQVYGGLGFTWECDLHLYLKRVQYDRVAFGNSGFHRDRLAGFLASRVRSGVSVI